MPLSSEDLADDEFSSRLVEIDEALVQGQAPPGAVQPDADLEPELQARLERSKSCLLLLNQIWPRSERSGSDSVSSQQLADGQRVAADGPLQIGRFRVVRELGHGGFGVVFLAIDQLLGREVALKVPRPEALLTPHLRQRFLREAMAAAALSHQNLLPIYEAGEIGPFCYIASEYCSGQNLAQWLSDRQAPVPFRLAADLVAKLADAVAHAHASGVLHRDIKPSNVLLEGVETNSAEPRDACKFRPKLTDFGLAKLLDRDVEADATPISAIIGTPGYMAPEQAAQNNAAIGPAADVYSLGAILYELITSQLPSGSKSGRPTVQQILSAEPVLPRKLRPRTPRDLEAIALKCLEKDPHSRYPSAAALATDLRRFLEGKPTAARPLGATRQTWRWVRRHPASAALLGLTSVALCIVPLGIAYLSRASSAVISAQQQSGHDQQLRAEAEQREEQLRRQYYATGVKLAGESLKQDRVREASQLLAAQRARPGQADLRGFAWRYLWRLSHGDPTILTTEPQEVLYLSFSPDGRFLATAGHDGLVKLWDVNTRTLSATLRGHTGQVNAVVFAPDGKALVSAGADETVRLWEIKTGRQQRLLLESAPEVLCMAYSRQGAFATGGRDRVVRVWDTATWKVCGELNGHAADVESLDFSPDGSQLVSGGADNRVLLWQLDGDGNPRSLEGHEATVTCVVFSHDGTVVASASEDHTVKLWNPASGQVTLNLPGHSSGINFAEFSFDDQLLVTVSKAGLVRLWDAKTGDLEKVVHGHDRQAWCAAFSPRDNSLVTSGADRKVKLWDLARLDNQRPLPEPSAPVSSLAFSPDSRLLAAGDVAGALYLYDLPAGTVRLTAREHSDRVTCLAFSRDGKRLASSSLDGTLRIWNPNSGSVEGMFAVRAGGAYSLAFSADGNQVAIGGGNGTITLRHVDNGQKQFELQRHTGPVTALVFADEDRSLVSGSHDGTVKLWDLSRPEQPVSLTGVNGRIESLDVTPDSEMLVAGGRSRTVYVWDLQNRVLLSSKEAHQATILSVSFGPRGRTLVSADAAGVVKLWNTIALDELVTLSGHKHEVAATAFSHDGMTLATGGRSATDRGEILLWLAEAEEN